MDALYHNSILERWQGEIGYNFISGIHWLIEQGTAAFYLFTGQRTSFKEEWLHTEEKKKDNYYGYTRNHKLINFTGDNIKAGDIVNVEVTDAKTWSLDGKLSK